MPNYHFRMTYAGVLLSLAACGSAAKLADDANDTVSLYTDQSVDVVIDWYDGGDPPPNACADGTRCLGYHYHHLTTQGVLTLLQGCIALPVRTTPVADSNTYCKLSDNTTSQLSAVDVLAVKETIVNAEPQSLQDSYACSANNSCYSYIANFGITMTVDGVPKVITWSDGGAAASAAFTAILKQASAVGL